MNRIVIYFVLFLSTVNAHDLKDAEKIVSQYFAFYGKQDFEGIAKLYHPDYVKQFKHVMDSLLLSDTTAITDADKKEMYETYGVKTIKELIALSPEVYFLKMLVNNNKVTKSLNAYMADVSTTFTFENEETYSDGYVIKANVISKINGKTYSGITVFVITEHKGKLLLRDMSKTRN